jgi:hypothetical protein
MENWTGKPKALVLFLSEKTRKEPEFLPQLIEILKIGSDPSRGTIADVLEQLSKETPELVVPFIKVIIEYLNYKAPRVKWGLAETIGNLSKQFPKETEGAIPNLLANTQDKGIVVRWSAAFALSEIARNNPMVRAELVSKMTDLAAAEKNSGVRKVYLKALKKAK